MILRTALLVLTLSAAAAHAAGDPARLAMEAAERIDRAAAALDGSRDGYGRIAALSRVIEAYDAGLEAVRAGLRTADGRARVLEARLADANGDAATVLAALTALGRAPEAMLLLHPGGPEATARAGMLMQAVAPALVQRVEAVRADMEELSALRDVQNRSLTDLAARATALRDARHRLAGAVEARGDLPQPVARDAALMETIAAGSREIAALGREMDALPAPRDPAAMLEAAQGALPMPVSGPILRAFREADAQGVARPGWLIDAAGGALVTAPWPGTVRYSGPLQDYGNVIVLEPQADFLMVFAGLSEVYGAAGRIVTAGMPVGTVAADAGTAPGRETGLYVEMRQGGQPVDPAEWFAPGQG